MAKETIFIGALFILTGVSIAVLMKSIISSAFFILIGILLITYNKEEDKIETRKDKKTRKK